MSNQLLRRRLLEHDHGTPVEQKDRLVSDIIDTFRDPAKWPMTDGERISVLKKWYQAARLIRDTETAQ